MYGGEQNGKEKGVAARLDENTPTKTLASVFKKKGGDNRSRRWPFKEDGPGMGEEKRGGGGDTVQTLQNVRKQRSHEWDWSRKGGDPPIMRSRERLTGGLSTEGVKRRLESMC